MTYKEKRELKDCVISIFKRFNILDHTATIGGLRDDILRYINSLQEEPVSEDLESVSKKYGKDTFVNECMYYGVCDDNDLADAFKAGAQWQKEKDKEEWLDKALDFFGSNYNSLVDGGVIGAFDDKEKMIEEFVEFMKDDNL